MARKALSKRMRFEIFKRDGFTCQYCGSKPPRVVLRVDHVLAVAAGGGNEPINLVTSCFDCNAGKSDKPLERCAPALKIVQEVGRERFEQLKIYNEWLSERADQIEQWFKLISDTWIQLEGNDPDEWRISGKRESAVRMFLSRLPAYEIIDALHIAFGRFHGASQCKIHAYFCGVCWRKIKGPPVTPNA